MPRQNRVTPFSTLIATPERGTLTGNRGCLHDEQGQIQRLYQGKRWIICLLEFKGRKRRIMQPGHYTELFFLDEATALAAGHRPCAECQRQRFNLFREIWAKANPESAGADRLSATALDSVLHRERLSGREFCSSILDLPDGVLVTDDERSAYLVMGKRWLRWSPAVYMLPERRDLHYPARILTPLSTVRALAAGYPVNLHPSAWEAGGKHASG